MTFPILWPKKLRPSAIMANPAPFSRSGGTSLGGIERTTRTDRGWWMIDYKSVALATVADRRQWNGLRTAMGGMAGTMAIRIWSFDTAPWAAGTEDGRTILIPHDDDTPFEDETMYSQSTIGVRAGTAIALGATSITLRIIYGIDELMGTRFSYQHALYELGIPTSVVGDLWTMPVFPAIRAAIPINADLEFDLPTCLVHLATDNAMDVRLSAGEVDFVDVSFKENVSYWNDLVTS